MWMLGDRQHAIEVPIRSRLSVTTAEAAIDAALAGIGITRVLSYQVAPFIHAGRLTHLLAESEPAPSPVQLVYPGQGRMPMKLRAFLDFMTPRLKQAIRNGRL
jgi:DNA-binding transcriptional LysR family regulator